MGGDWQGDDSIEKSLGIRSVIKKLRSQREEKNRDLAISFSNKYIVPRIEEKVSNGANSFSMELKNSLKNHLAEDRGGTVSITDRIYFYEILLVMLKDEGLKVSYSFDQKVVKWITDEFKKTSGIDLTKDGDAHTMSRLSEAATLAAIELSETSMSQINLPFIAMKDGNPAHLDLSLSRAKFEDLTSKKSNDAAVSGNKIRKHEGFFLPDRLTITW